MNYKQTFTISLSKITVYLSICVCVCDEYVFTCEADWGCNQLVFCSCDASEINIVDAVNYRLQ